MNTLPKELFHYSERPIEKLIRSNVYLDSDIFMESNDLKEKIRVASKPYGFWISIEDYEDDQTWDSWCRDQKFCLYRLICKHKIKLNESANILWINNKEDLINFSLKYDGNDKIIPGEQIKKYIKNYIHEKLIIFIDWKETIQNYDGIFIAPYQRSHRLPTSTSWYSGWDCSSGCIWNTNSIESIEVIEKMQLTNSFPSFLQV